MRSESDISIQFDHFVEQQQTASDLSPSDSDSNNEVEDIFVIIADLKEDVAKYENQYKSSSVKGFKDAEYQEYLVICYACQLSLFISDSILGLSQ